MQNVSFGEALPPSPLLVSACFGKNMCYYEKTVLVSAGGLRDILHRVQSE